MKNRFPARGLVLFATLAACFVTISVTNRKVDAAQPDVTWSGQIAPLVYKNCTTCHHPGGGGPFSLLTYHEAQRWGAQMMTVTQSRFMPPWLPEHGFGDFAGRAPTEQRGDRAIAQWVKAGMPEGDPAHGAAGAEVQRDLAVRPA